MSDAAVSFEEVLTALRSGVNARLEEYLALSDDCPDRLREAMAYSLLAGGKRLRPVLVLLACEACGGETDAALPAACALEMVHTYSLIHDDLPAMDDDDLRRGRPTCHMVFGEALAILAGDALLTRAFEILARDVQPPQVAAACCADLASAAGAVGMVGGQVADLEAEEWAGSRGQDAETRGRGDAEKGRGGDAEKGRGGDAGTQRRGEEESPRPRVSPSPRLLFPASPRPRVPASLGTGELLDHLEGIHRRKTGRLLASALTLGARVAGASAEQRQALEIYGKSVGLAFQIADDLLDVSGDKARMGKEVRKDADHGKLTYPGLLGADESRRRARNLIEQALRAIAPLAARGRRLEALAHFVLERDH